jgi:hypothetical protein
MRHARAIAEVVGAGAVFAAAAYALMFAAFVLGG